MKKLAPFLLLLALMGCKSESKDEPKSITITADQVASMVSYLSSDEIAGRLTGTEGIDKAATYIEEQLSSYGVKPYYETFRDSFKVADIDAFNVVGFLEGTDPKLKDEVIVIGAHYDHIGAGSGITRFGGRAVEKDSLANGANDNATGTGAVIAIANYFAEKRSHKRSLMFALFSAEEMGLLGSKHLAKRLKSDNVDLYTVVNFEMIGVPFTDKNYDAFLSGYNLSNMAEKFNVHSTDTLLGESEIAKKYQLFRRSDNFPFYEEYNIPAHTVSSCDLTNFDYYHHSEDETELMNFDHMASLINKLIPGIEAMASSDEREIKMYE